MRDFIGATGEESHTLAVPVLRNREEEQSIREEERNRSRAGDGKCFDPFIALGLVGSDQATHLPCPVSPILEVMNIAWPFKARIRGLCAIRRTISSALVQFDSTWTAARDFLVYYFMWIRYCIIIRPRRIRKVRFIIGRPSRRTWSFTFGHVFQKIH